MADSQVVDLHMVGELVKQKGVVFSYEILTCILVNTFIVVKLKLMLSYSTISQSSTNLKTILLLVSCHFSYGHIPNSKH